MKYLISVAIVVVVITNYYLQDRCKCSKWEEVLAKHVARLETRVSILEYKLAIMGIK